MNWKNAPIGMVRFDELINTLNALALTGGCDYRTLVIVAAAYGLSDYLRKPHPDNWEDVVGQKVREQYGQE